MTTFNAIQKEFINYSILPRNIQRQCLYAEFSGKSLNSEVNDGILQRHEVSAEVYKNFEALVRKSIKYVFPAIPNDEPIELSMENWYSDSRYILYTDKQNNFIIDIDTTNTGAYTDSINPYKSRIVVNSVSGEIYETRSPHDLKHVSIEKTVESSLDLYKFAGKERAFDLSRVLSTFNRNAGLGKMQTALDKKFENESELKKEYTNWLKVMVVIIDQISDKLEAYHYK
jgi:hypothetical protein